METKTVSKASLAAIKANQTRKANKAHQVSEGLVGCIHTGCQEVPVVERTVEHSSGVQTSFLLCASHAKA